MNAVLTARPINVSALDAATRPRHRWYFVKEAFSPDIVNHALTETNCSPTGTVYDPFCGSGTVPLEAAIKGHQARAVEVNPFLAFVSRTKLRSVDPDTLLWLSASLVSKIEKGKRSWLEGYSTFSPQPSLKKWLFNLQVLRGRELGRRIPRRRPDVSSWRSNGLCKRCQRRKMPPISSGVEAASIRWYGFNCGVRRAHCNRGCRSC
jgi:hypothetical protein